MDVAERIHVGLKKKEAVCAKEMAKFKPYSLNNINLKLSSEVGSCGKRARSWPGKQHSRRK